jgi:hypothetical protein
METANFALLPRVSPLNASEYEKVDGRRKRISMDFLSFREPPLRKLERLAQINSLYPKSTEDARHRGS